MNQPPPPNADLGNARPELRKDLRCSLQHCGGQPYYLLEDPVNARFYRVGLREWDVASRLDGQRTLREIVQLVTEEKGDDALSAAETASLFQWLSSSQLVRDVSARSPATILRVPQHTNLLRWLNPFFIKIPLLNPDRLLTAMLPWLRWTLSRPFFACWIMMCLAGGYQIIANWDRFWASTAGVLAPDNWIYLILVWVVLKIVHELYHGLVCKKYGGTVPRAGVILILFSPLAFVDVTSSWRFRSKWQRIYTSAAGMYIEFLLAAAAGLIWSHTEAGIVNHVCHNIVLMASLTTLIFNGNFLMKFDGYYILTDLLDIQNLYPSGQQYMRYLSRRYLLGVRAAIPDWKGTRRNIIRTYGVASFFWRILLYFSLGAVAATLFHGLGLVLTALALVMWLALPTWRFAQYMIHGTPHEQPNRLRFATVTTLAGGCFALLLALPWPGGVRAPAIVEYAPLTVVRADSSGFVRQVLVQPGEVVDADQVLAVLSEPKTDAELRDLDLAIQQSDVKCRIHHSEQEMDKYLVEIKNREALQEKRDELSRQVQGLTVRAATAGRVIGRNLDILIGQYLETGQPLMALGLESQKELQVSVSQDSVESFQGQVGSLPHVKIRGRKQKIHTGTLARINPRASVVPAHVALVAPGGGPLPVKIADSSDDRNGAHSYELVEPRFTGIVDLPADQSSNLRAGELAMVRLAQTDESIGRHLYQRISRWLRNKLTPRTSSTA